MGQWIIPPAMRPQAVVFDMDGLMVDTERVIKYTWDVTGERMGYKNFGDNILHTLGKNRDQRNEYFRKNNFYLVPDLPALQRVPELVNGQWWNRVDFTAVFYEYVRRESKVKTIEHVNIKATAISKGKELTEYVKSEN